MTRTAKAMSYVCGSANTNLLGKCIGEVLEDTANQFPSNDALVVCHQRHRLTYAELRNQVWAAARAFMSLGIEKGDRIGIWSTNCSEWVVTQFAAASIGAILVNINPANQTRELEYVLRQSECQTLIVGRGFRGVDYTSIVREICPTFDQHELGNLAAERLPDLRNIVLLGEEGSGAPASWAA